MSAKETTVVLKPPERIRNEGFVSRGHSCGYCHGKGSFHGERDMIVTCPDCEGTGELMAVVTVEWKPNIREL